MTEAMLNVGNLKAKKEFEAKVPSIWTRPTPDASLICREQWIRAKYERKEFIPTAPEILRPYLTGLRQGFLYKRKKKSDDWKSRYFVLDEENLSYFINSQDKKPKASISLLAINATFDAPGLDDHSYSLLLTYRVNGRSRSIFIYSDTGHEMMDWFLAIKCAKLKYLLKKCDVKTTEEELLKDNRVTWNFTLTGYMYKMPPNQKKFQRRFFILDKNNLRYYDKPKDPFPLGEIQIGRSGEGYSVSNVVPDHLTDQKCVFMLGVPCRSGGGFPLMADSDKEREEWMAALKNVIVGPIVTLEDAPCDAYTTYENEREHLPSITKFISNNYN
jgi:hypothetical protein